jgi:hypothetical protein
MNALDYGSNNWDNGYPSGGNYWSNYNGSDNNHGPNQNISGSDGIGDTPYPIPSGSNQDHYPFMSQNGWENNPPNIPQDPNPQNHATDISIYTDLSWTGGDLDLGDNVTYDVYFEDDGLQKIVSNQTATSYALGTLSYDVQYCWMIVAWDNHGE